MSNNKKIINYGLFTVILFSALLAVYASILQSSSIGISAFDYLDNRFIVALQDRFVILGDDGEIEHNVEFAEVGIKGPVRDVKDLRYGGYLVGDGGSESLFMCTQFMFSCSELSDKFNKVYKIGRFHKFVTDEDNQQIFLSNTEKHELVLLDMQGSLIKKLIDKKGELRFPDGIVQLNDSELLLANSLDSEVLKINLNDSQHTIINKYKINSDFVFNGEHLPMTVTRVPDGDWWVTAQASTARFGHSSLLVFDAQWQAIKRITDDKLISPVDVLVAKNEVFIADSEANAIFAYSHNSNALERFGSDEFNDILESQRSMKSFSIYLKNISIAILLICLGIALVVEKRRKKAEEALFNSQQASEELHITIPGHMASMMRILPILMIVLLIISGFLLKGSSTELILTIGPLMVLMIVSVSILSYITSTKIPASIKVSGDQISVENVSKNLIQDEIQHVSYTDSIVCIKGEYFMFGNKGALIKNKNSYKLLLERLKEGELVTAGKMQIRLLKRHLVLNMVAFSSIILMILHSFLFILNADQDVKKEIKVIDETVHSKSLKDLRTSEIAGMEQESPVVVKPRERMVSRPPVRRSYPYQKSVILKKLA